MRSVVYASILAAAMAVMVAVPSTAMAQVEAPNVAQVTVVQIDGVNLDAFMEPIKKAQAIWKELGMPAFRAWQSTLAGPNTGAIVFVTLYDDNVAWAKAQGITTGTTAVTFSPQDPVTRAQAAAFLYRDAGSPPV